MTAVVQIPFALTAVFGFLLVVLGLSVLPTLHRPSPAGWPPPTVPGGHPYNKRSAVVATSQLPGGAWSAPVR